jgi:hypothetical protein
MQSKLTVATLVLATLAHAQAPKHRQSGVLLQMDSVACGSGQDSGKASEAVLAVSAQANAPSLCQEYTLQSDRTVFHIRPKDQQRAVLLPVGGIALFRLDHGKMLLRAADLDDKDREYTVVSMTPREDNKPAETPLPKLNHLQ